MPAIKDDALVLRRLDYSESSQVLVVLTRTHGLRRLIAKGAKRSTKTRFVPGIDLLERGWVVFLPGSRGDSHLGTLTEWLQTEAYLGLRTALPQWYAAQYAADVTVAAMEEAEPHVDLFDALAELLGALSAGRPPLPEVVGYQCALLRSLGLWPDLTRCVLCDRVAPPGRAAYYGFHQGGLVCSQCVPAAGQVRKVGAAVLTSLRESDWLPDTVGPALALLDETLRHLIGRGTLLGKLDQGKVGSKQV